MAVKEILVTGASGFIGTNLVQRLVAAGHRVSCLVRASSRLDELNQLGVTLLSANLADPDSLAPAVHAKDWIFHLAGTVNHASWASLVRTNVGGTKNLLTACQAAPIPPIVVHVSSLAATGPCPRNSPHRESAVAKPVSNYGFSKLESERVARSFGNRIPISIVRPPIVLGANDPNSLQLFQMIDRWNLHVVAGYFPQRFSVIHVDDLVEALIAVADRGRRLTSQSEEQGLYFAAADEVPTFGELGKMIALALRKNWVLRLPVPRFMISATGGLNSAINSVFKSKLYLTLDKAREANAGSWACCCDKIKQETGWKPAVQLQQRLEEIAAQAKRGTVQLT